MNKSRLLIKQINESKRYGLNRSKVKTRRAKARKTRAWNFHTMQ